jgi:ATP-dependent exoDNAse (exonuclease V) alpha subunit
MVKTLVRLQQRVVLLAPTGRAAKVFSLNAGYSAYTIHRRIYRQKSLEGGFGLNFNALQDALFVVDEASMIGTSPQHMTTTTLLDDLIQFVYEGRNCRLMLIGDKAQLPPVGEEESPALMAGVLRQYGMKVYECDLNEVLRQSQDSGILYNATVIRQMMTRDQLTQLPYIRFQGFADILSVPGDELIEQLNTSYSEVGIDETMVITRSNKRANIYNQGIRNVILGREEELTTGDMLMVVKNNYSILSSLPRREEAGHAQAGLNGSPAGGGLEGGFIANGDRARVLRVRNVRELYGFHFADVWLQFPDYDQSELQAVVILDSLASESPALTHEQNEQLFNAVMEDYADIPSKQERLKRLKVDRYFNALQVKYAYAVTCHKAQGGQWAHVYVDQGYMTDDMLTSDYIHWLYTAFTRASEKLFLVNWKNPSTEGGGS